MSTSYSINADYENSLNRGNLKTQIKFKENEENTYEPVDPLNFDMHKLMRDKPNSENFKEFLRQNYAIMDLECWIDIESYM